MITVHYFRHTGGMLLELRICNLDKYDGGPKNNRNVNVARELEVVARFAATCRESTQYSSSLPRGVSLG
jgi:ABC-type phosphate/phosphonate transport system permease subunit